MSNIPEKLKKELSIDPFYEICVRENKDCEGYITWEHCFIYAGKQVQEKWAIIPLCELHHSVNKYLDVGKLDKGINQLIALSRASEKDLEKYPRVNWKQMLKSLRIKYGKIWG